MPNITKKQPAYIMEYPEAVKFADTQLSVFWTADEIEVEKDIQDIKVNMDEAESHGVITTLKLFTLYELIAGDEYWGGKVSKWFPKPCIRRMANAFSFFELNSHAPFYNKLNEALGLDTEEFYNSYVEDPILKNRMDFVDGVVKSNDKLLSLGAFSMVEGAILYSSFAFLKHFQSQGKNMLNNVVAGINFSVRDENLHAEGGAWLYRTLRDESKLSQEAREDLEKRLIELAFVVYDHECFIIDMIFEKGTIRGITDLQMKHFVQSRLNLCLKNLDIDPIFEVTYNPIASWFYKGINSLQFNDFFNRVGSEYNRNWKEEGFVW